MFIFLRSADHLSVTLYLLQFHAEVVFFTSIYSVTTILSLSSLCNVMEGLYEVVGSMQHSDAASTSSHLLHVQTIRHLPSRISQPLLSDLLTTTNLP